DLGWRGGCSPLDLTQAWAARIPVPLIPRLLDRASVGAMVGVALALAGPAIAVFALSWPHRPLVEARTLATAVVVVGTIALALAEPHRSVFRRPERWLMGAIVLGGFLGQTYGGDALGAVPLSPRSWAVALLAGSCPFWVREANSNAAATATAANSGGPLTNSPPD
ncbi:MAG: hypothetical protein HC918_11880, partial [Oscillatoriales cyanobacterium SM2_1_8]|nr:hypothetical protein [Oscillatoriales cyanobacterium SM2_1_8]